MQRHGVQPMQDVQAASATDDFIRVVDESAPDELRCSAGICRVERNRGYGMALLGDTELLPSHLLLKSNYDVAGYVLFI